jgi:2-phosphoglycerate kinase
MGGPSEGKNAFQAATPAGQRVQDPWRVLLIAGSSGVGKTILAQALGRRLGVSVLLVDDLRIAVQELTTAASHPDLHLFLSDRSVSEMTTDEAVQRFIATATALAPAIRTIIAHHLVVRGVGSVIIEGDGVLPALAATQQYGDLKLFHGLTPSAEVRMIVLHEADQGELLANFLARGRAFETLTGSEQAALVHAAWRYGESLRQEASGLGVPVIASRPHATLTERVLSELASDPLP